MSITIRVPWTVTMSPVGPSIEYAGDYKFNRIVNVNDNTSTLRCAGPLQTYGFEVDDEHADLRYKFITELMEFHTFKMVRVTMTGQVYVEWEEVEGIGQAMHITIGSNDFSCLWRISNSLFDEGEFAVEAASTLVSALDPAQSAVTIENLVKEIGKILDELFEISFEVGRMI